MNRSHAILTTTGGAGRKVLSSLFALVALVFMGFLAASTLSTVLAGGPGTVHVAADGADTVGCGTEADPCRTIDFGVDEASVGDTVQIAAGEYTFGDFVVDKLVHVSGAGSGADTATNTVVTGAGTLIEIAASGTSATDRLTVSNLRASGNGAGRGVVIDGTLSFIGLDNVSSIGHDVGLDIGADALITDLEVTDSSFNDSSSSNMRIGGEVTTFAVSGSSFDGAGIWGWRVTARNQVTNVFDDVTVTDTTFNNNARVGIAVEKLSNAVFDGITVDNSGTDPGHGFNHGIYIDLHYEDYANIEIKNSTISNSGDVATSGGGSFTNPLYASALSIQVRDEAPAFDTQPATLTGLDLTSLTVSDNVNGIVFGDPVVVQGGPSDAVVSYSDLTDNSGAGLANFTSGATVDVRNNWWGCNEGPGDSDCAALEVSGIADVAFDPWLTLTMDVGATALKKSEDTTLTAMVTINSDGIDTAGDGAIPDGTSVNFGPVNQVIPDDAGTVDGVATTEFTAPGAGSGNRLASATLDNETIEQNITFGNCEGEAATIVGAGVIVGTSGDDVIKGNGADDITGNGGNDIICAHGSDDIIDGGSGNDTINAGGGDDEVSGDSGDDVIFGDAGNDTLQGNGNEDELRGKGGNDTLEGGADPDELFGGNGTDTCDGGSGVDTEDSCELP